jgi:Tfp pilus assembly protein PilX
MRKLMAKYDELPLASRRNQRGAALVTTLLLLLLLIGMSLTMVLSVSSDMLINGYYRNYRSSFYAADSGLSIARQTMVSEILAAVPATFNSSTVPIPPGTDAAVQSNILSTYGQNSSLNSGQSASSWPEMYRISAASLALVTVPPQPVVSTDKNGNVTAYQYTYNYSITSIGQSRGNENTTLTDSGSLIINATLTPGGPVNVSFAAWGMFIDQWSICSGSTLVPGTITGPVFTNGAWTFGDSGSYTFTDPVGSVSSQAGYSHNNGKCDSVAGKSDKSGNSTIAPNFQAGLNLGQPAVPLPPNDYNQKRAVVDGIGTSGTPVTNSDLNKMMRDVNKNPYPSTGTNSGVFLPYSVDSTGKATFVGGGIYVKGDANVTLSTSGNSAEVYTVVQNGVTTTITIDPSSNTTVVSAGGNTTTINGVPTQNDPSTGAVTRDATMLYVDGNITSLSGPGQGKPAIQDGTALTITAANNVTVTGDILYKNEPVTQTQNQIPGTPADTLIPGNDKQQVLGIFTGTGDIQLKNSQSNGNLEIDGSVATISQNGSGGLVNTGNAINTLTIVGGRIQNQIKNINTTTRNVFFDRRFAKNGFAPPWFPSTTVSQNGSNSASLTTSVQRVQWLNKSSYF